MLVALPRPSKRAISQLLRQPLAALAAGAIVSIGPIGPIAPAVAGVQVFRVYIQNNLAEPVVVRDCDSYCSSSALDLNLSPGASAPINRIANDPKFFSVTSDSGQHLGCLDLYFSKRQPGASVPVSGTVQCPGSNIPWTPIIGISALLVIGFGLFMRTAATR